MYFNVYICLMYHRKANIFTLLSVSISAFSVRSLIFSNIFAHWIVYCLKYIQPYFTHHPRIPLYNIYVKKRLSNKCVVDNIFRLLHMDIPLRPIPILLPNGILSFCCSRQIPTNNSKESEFTLPISKHLIIFRTHKYRYRWIRLNKQEIYSANPNEWYMIYVSCGLCDTWSMMALKILALVNDNAVIGENIWRCVDFSHSRKCFWLYLGRVWRRLG